VERDLDDEIGAYVDELMRRRMATGIPASEARRLALAEVGTIEGVKDGVRDAVPGIQLDAWLKDVAIAGRTLRRQRGFSAVIVMTPVIRSRAG